MCADQAGSVTEAGGAGKGGSPKMDVVSTTDLIRLVEQEGGSPNGTTALKALEKRKLSADEARLALNSTNYSVKLVGIKYIGKLDTLSLINYIESVGENTDPNGTAAMKELQKRCDKRQLSAMETRRALDSNNYSVMLVGVNNISKLDTASLMNYIEIVGATKDPNGTAAMKELEKRKLSAAEVKFALNSKIYSVMLLGVRYISKLDTSSLITYILSVGENTDPNGTAAMKELENRKLGSFDAKLALGSKNYRLMLIGLKYIGKIDTMYLISYVENVGAFKDPDGTAVMRELEKRQLSSDEAKRALESPAREIKELGMKFVR